MWRHLLTYAGGQGIVVIALTFLFKGTAGAYKVYVGEGKDERLLPNVVQTARAIWLVSLTWLVVGTARAGHGRPVSWGRTGARRSSTGCGCSWGRGRTGGFAPQSYNTMWFHSLSYEIITIVIMIAGSFNFALHWAVWTGQAAGDPAQRRDGQLRDHAHADHADRDVLAGEGRASTRMRWRCSARSSTSSHRGTRPPASRPSTRGRSSPSGDRSAWLATTIAMAIGASACSTAGGIKGIRMGVIAKAFMQDIRRMISPESAVVREKYHHIRDVVSTTALVRTAMTITIAYLALYGVMAMVGTLSGYDFLQAAFEGVSAASNTGLSCGVTSPAMPDVHEGHLHPGHVARPARVHVRLRSGRLRVRGREGPMRAFRMVLLWLAALAAGVFVQAAVFPAAVLAEESTVVTSGAVIGTGGSVSSTELVEHPREWDGKTIVFVGEAVGEVMVRGDHAWIHLNDDAYMLAGVEEGAAPAGYNSGMPVWISAEPAASVRVLGDHTHQGDVVRVEGVFNAACAEHGGDMDIHATALSVVRPGHEVHDPIQARKLMWLLGLAALAAAVMAAELGGRRRRARPA